MKEKYQYDRHNIGFLVCTVPSAYKLYVIQTSVD